MVTGRHHNAIVVRQLLVARVIREENPAGGRDERSPHRWPHEIGFEADEEVKDVSIELRVEGVVVEVAVFGPPAGQGGCFIVDKDSTVFDTGLPVGGCFVQGVDSLVLGDGDVGPPVKAIQIR